MKTSESIANIAAALCKFQSEVPSIERSKEVKVNDKSGKYLYSFNYSPLDHVVEVCKPILTKYGLSVIQMISQGATVETIILHESGEYISECFTLQPQTGGKPQEIGSAITYARRYAYCAAIGVVSEEDDDGNASQGQYTTPTDGRKWLNPGTPEWKNAVQKLSSDEIKIEDIDNHYRLSKVNREKILTESI